MNKYTSYTAPAQSGNKKYHLHKNIMAFSRNAYARVRLKIGVWAPPTDSQLTDYLNMILRQGVSNLQINARWIRFTCMRQPCVLRNDNGKNWLSAGRIGAFTWNGVRPAAYPMLRFKRMLRRQMREQLAHDLDEYMKLNR